MVRLSQTEGGRHRVLVVGDDAVGVYTARSIPGEVTFAALDESLLRRVDDSSVTSVLVEDRQNLDLSVESVDAAILATGVDSLNLLYGRRLQVDEQVTEIVARVSDPWYHDVFDDLGITTVCVTADVSNSLAEMHTQLVE